MSTYISEEKIKEIQNSVNIVDVVGENVILKKNGKNYIGLCPFHSEKTGSFSVSPGKQMFYCFGCGIGGNVFSFLMQFEGLTFPHNLKKLVTASGIDIPMQALSPEERTRMQAREDILMVNRQAMEFFKEQLQNSGQKAINYLKGRGLSLEVIKAFGLGYAQPGWDRLLTFLKSRSIKPDLAVQAGLVIKKDHGNSFYDRFRDRIIFPIIDAQMRIIGFGGRVLDTSLPKYLNTPETMLYSKSNSLYGLNLARTMSRETDQIFLVEGYLDVISLYQAGIKNVAATLGTALTPGHLRLLKSFAHNLTLVYDSDAAGLKAAQRSITIFQKEAVDARIMVLPIDFDPDAYVNQFGGPAFLEIADKAMSIMIFMMEMSVKNHGLSIEGKIRIIEELSPSLRAVKDQVAYSLYIRALSERTGIDETTIMTKIGFFQNQPLNAPINPNQSLGKHRIEHKIIAMMLQFKPILPEIRSKAILEHFKDQNLKSIGKTILQHEDQEVSVFLHLMKGQEQIVTHLSMTEDQWQMEGCLNLLKQFQQINFRSDKTIMQQIKAAEQANNDELMFQLLRQRDTQIKQKN